MFSRNNWLFSVIYVCLVATFGASHEVSDACIDISQNCSLHSLNCHTSSHVQRICKKTCNLCEKGSTPDPLQQCSEDCKEVSAQNCNAQEGWLYTSFCLNLVQFILITVVIVYTVCHKKKKPPSSQASASVMCNPAFKLDEVLHETHESVSQSMSANIYEELTPTQSLNNMRPQDTRHRGLMNQHWQTGLHVQQPQGFIRHTLREDGTYMEMTKSQELFSSKANLSTLDHGHYFSMDNGLDRSYQRGGEYMEMSNPSK